MQMAKQGETRVNLIVKELLTIRDLQSKYFLDLRSTDSLLKYIVKNRKSKV